MRFDEILARFPDAKNSGDGWAAKCPAHLDGSPSLAIREGSDGRTLLHCHAGCAPQAICTARGLTLADLFPPKETHNGGGKRIVATYDYQDASGKVVFQVVRYVPKDFRQRRPDATAPDSWTWKTSGIEKVLFRLPEIHRAIASGKFIFLNEGEKDTLAMVQRGFDATCNAGGAGKWQDSYTETLRGADVVIVADKDKAGRDHAQLVAGKLHGVAKSVRVIELPDTNGKPVKDAHDFFTAGGTAENLIALVDTAPEWTPQAAPVASSNRADVAAGYLGDDVEQPQQSLIERLTARIYSPQANPVEPTPRFFLAGIPISTPGNLATISAHAKAGKSAAIGGMIASTFAASDADCLGFTSQNPNGFAVVHLDTEQCPFDHWQGIERALCRAKIASAPLWLRSYCLTGFSAADVRASIRILIEQAAKQFGGVHSVFIDGVADAAPDVNDPAETSSLITELHKLAIEFDCPVLNIIHVNPGSDFKTRGHLGSQLERKSETNLRLEKDDDGASVIWADKNRRAPIPKNTAPRFVWSEEHEMHVTAQSIKTAQDDTERETLTELARDIFTDRPAMRYSDLQTTVKTRLAVSDRTAERKVTRLRQLGVVKKTIGGLYELKA